MPPKHVSKHIPAARLESLKVDNCISESGVEYNEAELNDELISRQVSAAESLADSYLKKYGQGKVDAWTQLGESFRVCIKTIKEEGNYSYSGIAARLGCTRQALNIVISGRRRPSMRMILQAVDAFGMSFELKAPRRYSKK